MTIGRKSAARYPVQAEVEYRLKQGRRVIEAGRSHAVTLSSSEVVLASERRLAEGMDIELFLTWPGPLGTEGGLVLRIQGRTLASRGKRTKVQIGRYGFETRSKPSAKSADHLPHAATFAS